MTQKQDVAELRIGREWMRDGKRERLVNVRGEWCMVARWIAPRHIVRRLELAETVRQYITEEVS